jgi:CrcB protein
VNGPALETHGQTRICEDLALDAWLRILWLSLGGALGVNARYWLAFWIDRQIGTRFPWATLTINLSGAFVLGLLGTMAARFTPHHPARLFWLVGFLGGYTTFSTFALESHKLLDADSAGRSLAYMFGSVLGGLLAVTLGILLARSLGFNSGPYPQRSAGAEAAAAAGLTTAAVLGAELAELD